MAPKTFIAGILVIFAVGRASADDASPVVVELFTLAAIAGMHTAS